MFELIVEMSSAVEREEVERKDVHAILRAQFARNVAIDAAIVNVIRPADENERWLVSAREFVECLGTGFQNGLVEITLSSIGCGDGAFILTARDVESLCGELGERLFHVFTSVLEIDSGSEKLVAIGLKLGKSADDKRQCLVPRAEMRVLHAFGRFHVEHVGQEDVVDALLDEVVDVTVCDLHRIARLRDCQFIASYRDGAIGLRRYDDVETELLEVGAPEWKAIIEEHGARNTDDGTTVDCRLQDLL